MTAPSETAQTPAMTDSPLRVLITLTYYHPHRTGLTLHVKYVAEELAARKTNLVGSFNVSLATTSGIASALLDAVNSGREVSWLDEYPQRIMALTLEEVNAAIRTHIDPARMVLVKAGTMAEPASAAH